MGDTFTPQQEGAQAPDQELKRALGPFLILALSFGSIMGTGMFFGAAIGAEWGGAASILAWAILLPLTLYIASCFGELSSMFPFAGGIYEFCKQAYGRLPSFFVGWLGWIAGNFSNTVVVVAGVEYLLPQEEFVLLRVAVSIVILVLLNIIALFGVEESGIVVSVLVGLTVVIVTGILIFGIINFEPGNYKPFMSSGILPVLVATFLLIESFDGWESISYMAEETKNPEKNIPRALMWGTFFVWVASAGIHIIAFGVVPWQEILGSNAPLSLLFDQIFSPAFDLPLRIGIFLTLVGSAAGGVISMPRLLLALARDKLFLTQFSAVHPKFKTPHKAIIFQTIASILIIGMTIGNYEKLLSLFVPLALMLYTVTLLTVPVLRKRLPDVNRPFKAPFGSFGPYLVAILFAGLVVVWLMIEDKAFPLLFLGASLVLLGLPLYFLIELYYDPEMITEVRDLTAQFQVVNEKLFFPKFMQDEIFQWLGDLRGKRILEFGCGVGTLTLRLSQMVGPQGGVYATDLSLNSLKIAKRRVEQEAWKARGLTRGKVYVLHDRDHTIRVHPQISQADTVISFGMLSYLQDPGRVLSDMYRMLPEGGKICFVDFVDFFRFMPNPEWLSNNAEIERIFRHAGFSVRVQRKKVMFGLWKYVFLYGIKLKYDVPII